MRDRRRHARVIRPPLRFRRLADARFGRGAQRGDLGGRDRERRPEGDDVGARLSATGHVFEVLAVALDDERLREPWVTRAADRLTTLLERTADVAVECGGLYHACHGLAIYRRRVCGVAP